MKKNSNISTYLQPGVVFHNLVFVLGAVLLELLPLLLQLEELILQLGLGIPILALLSLETGPLLPSYACKKGQKRRGSVSRNDGTKESVQASIMSTTLIFR